MTSIYGVQANKNVLFSENVPYKNAPMPPMSRIGPDTSTVLQKYTLSILYKKSMAPF